MKRGDHMAENVETIYARSLFEAAKEANKMEEIKAGLEEVTQILAENKDFVTLLSSPAVSKADKSGMLSAVFDGRTDEYLANFLKILAQNGRISYFDRIVEEFTSLYNQEKNILAVTAVTAVKMSAALQKKLLKKLETVTGKTVMLETKVDPAVLGGVLLRYDNKELDGTVRERLNGLHRAVRSGVL